MQIEFKNITTLTKTEQLQILDWRNSESIRSKMLNQEIISPKDHLSYCEKLKQDNTTLLFRVSVNQAPCGMVNFANLNYTNKTGEYGLYVVDERPGIGPYLGRLAVYYFFELLSFSELNIIILSTNKTSILFSEKLLLFKDPYVNKREFTSNGQALDAVHYTMTKKYWEQYVKEQYIRNLSSIEFIVNDEHYTFSEKN